ncbi:MAG TPA: class I SAM-dependent methyltransferase [Dermatophilaceae bacterium]|nr:class I SAM-dependent methyltransferase [Dermatophilaceae bacterium]
MTETPRLFGDSLAEDYRRGMVPQYFQAYAEQLASLVAARPEARLRTADVLELAAGTGVLSRELARALPDAKIIATDLAQPMLDQALADDVPANLRYRQADAADLPFDDSCFDLVVSQFGVMLFPDKPKAFAEARRVLRHGGELVLLVWDTLEHNEIAELARQTYRDLLGESESLWLSTGPHGYADHARIRADVEAAGLRLDTLSVLPASTPEVTAAEVARAHTLGTPMRSVIEAAPAVSLQDVTDALERRLTARFGSGTFRSPLQAILVSATNPGD